MSNKSIFNEVVKPDTPRLVVMFKMINDKEMFQWGVYGHIPLIPIIGYIARLQSNLESLANYDCPETGLVITWDSNENEFECFLHPDVPIYSITGMLETIKLTLVSSNIARSAANQQVILGPDGHPANMRI